MQGCMPNWDPLEVCAWFEGCYKRHKLAGGLTRSSIEWPEKIPVYSQRPKKYSCCDGRGHSRIYRKTSIKRLVPIKRRSQIGAGAGLRDTVLIDAGGV
jgi:hypothetical protein